MKRQGILNSEISRVLTYMGHTDQICIGDCGLPIPEAKRVYRHPPLRRVRKKDALCQHPAVPCQRQQE